MHFLLSSYTDSVVEQPTKTIHTIIDFSDIIHCHVFYLDTTFQSLDSAPSSGKKPTQFGPIDTASPYLRSPESGSELL
jgi:hypothetical protein